MKKLPIGISDFKKIIENDYYYVDKTLLIKEILDLGTEVLLIPRPRRFGKTLNLSMLHYFFENASNNLGYLFANKKVWQDEEIKRHQGQYPVIFLTFKDLKKNNWQSSYDDLKTIISNEFIRHKSITLSNENKDYLTTFDDIVNKKASQSDFSTCLRLLSKMLNNHYKKKTIILIDEYDTPILAGYTEGYYKEVIEFMRTFLSSALKDNFALEKGIITGILRTAKEGIFSGLNNIRVYNLTSSMFQDRFGFTNDEVEQFLTDYNLSVSQADIQEWYNGYHFGQTIIYNPWSLILCAEEKGLLKPYWVNTSDNKIIKKIIIDSPTHTKDELQSLLNDQTIVKEIDEAIIFPNIGRNPNAIWNFLLWTGYITYTKQELLSGRTFLDLKIPNREIKVLYQNLIKEIFDESINWNKANVLFDDIFTGDVERFTQILQEFIFNSISYFDIPESESEKSYHLFVLGLLILLEDKYQIKSNKESGLGRYDIMLIPKNKSDVGVIIEFKKVYSNKETLEVAVTKALEQIIQKKYNQEFLAQNIKKVISYGIAFEGKEILIKKL